MEDPRISIVSPAFPEAKQNPAYRVFMKSRLSPMKYQYAIGLWQRENASGCPPVAPKAQGPLLRWPGGFPVQSLNIRLILNSLNIRPRGATGSRGYAGSDQQGAVRVTTGRGDAAPSPARSRGGRRLQEPKANRARAASHLPPGAFVRGSLRSLPGNSSACILVSGEG